MWTIQLILRNRLLTADISPESFKPVQESSVLNASSLKHIFDIVELTNIKVCLQPKHETQCEC